MQGILRRHDVATDVGDTRLALDLLPPPLVAIMTQLLTLDPMEAK